MLSKMDINTVIQNFQNSPQQTVENLCIVNKNILQLDDIVMIFKIK